MRQLTLHLRYRRLPYISKLPMRQLTREHNRRHFRTLSKLPMRQLTLYSIYCAHASVSKLPMRQLTDAGAEKEADSTCAYTSFSHFDPNLFLL